MLLIVNPVSDRSRADEEEEELLLAMLLAVVGLGSDFFLPGMSDRRFFRPFEAPTLIREHASHERDRDSFDEPSGASPRM
jgi:hypothetical protein